MITKGELAFRLADLELYMDSFEQQLDALNKRIIKLEKAKKVTKKVTKKEK